MGVYSNFKAIFEIFSHKTGLKCQNRRFLRLKRAADEERHTSTVTGGSRA